MRQIGGKKITGRQRIAAAGVAATLLAFAASPPGFAAVQAPGQSSPGGEIVTLTQCVDQAAAAGPGMKLSAASLTIAQAQYRQAAAANALGVDGNLSANHQGAPYRTRDVAAGTPTVAQDTAQGTLGLTAPLSTSVGLSLGHTIDEVATLDQTSSLSLSASSTLWDGYPGGAGLAAVKKAALALQVTQVSEDSNRKDIIYQVKQAYYTLLGQQRQLAILQQTLTQRQEEMKKTQALFNAQSANQIDLKQAQVNQKQSELELKKAQMGLEVAREQLSALVGWPLEKQYSVAEVEDLPPPSFEVPDAVKAALARRDDLRQLALSLALGEIDLALKKGQATPTVKANASVTWSRDWTANGDYATWSAGVTMQAPIIDAGSAPAQVEAAALANEKLRIQQEQLAAGIATGVKSAIYTMRDLLARVELAQESLDLGQNQYELARLQFDSGVSSNLDVLAASVALTTAEVSMAKARADAQLGVLALQKALGN